LAERILSENTEVLHIAEIDSSGRVVVLVPYYEQVLLRTFNIASAVLPPNTTLESGVNLPLVHRDVLSGRDSKVVSFIAPIKRAEHTHFLLLTARRNILPAQLNATAFGLFSHANDLVMYSGSESSLEKSKTASGRVEVPSVPGYYVVAVAPLPASASNPLLVSLIGVSIIYLLLFSYIGVAARALLSWNANLQHKQGSLRTHMQDNVLRLAHDFEKPLHSVQMLITGVSGEDLSLEQLQKLSGAITGMITYIEYLRKKLVQDVFDASAAAALESESGTYLRGTLELVVQEQEPALQPTYSPLPAGDQEKYTKHKIPIMFPSPFPGGEPFVDISRGDLRRIFSNLVRNAIEACQEIGTHEVIVRVSPAGEGRTAVRVIDNGPGVPIENQERIYEADFSTRGENRGKGLAIAVDIARTWHAIVRQDRSHVGPGACFEVIMNNRTTPPWFANSITINDKTVLVIVDDERLAFNYWTKAIAERLEGVGLPEHWLPRLIGVSGPAELRGNKEALEEGTLFLVDHHFEKESTTGVELIEELGLAHKAILVTNLMDKADVLSAVARLKLRMLPKVYLLNSKFPIEIGGSL
jgi:signal transduction histidine kinase